MPNSTFARGIVSASLVKYLDENRLETTGQSLAGSLLR
jgi:hypothetical protein